MELDGIKRAVRRFVNLVMRCSEQRTVSGKDGSPLNLWRSPPPIAQTPSVNVPRSHRCLLPARHAGSDEIVPETPASAAGPDLSQYPVVRNVQAAIRRSAEIAADSRGVSRTRSRGGTRPGRSRRRPIGRGLPVVFHRRPTRWLRPDRGGTSPNRASSTITICWCDFSRVFSATISSRKGISSMAFLPPKTLSNSIQQWSSRREPRPRYVPA